MDELIEMLFGTLIIIFLICLFIEYVLPVLIISGLILGPAGTASFYIGRQLQKNIREQYGLTWISVSTLIIVGILTLFAAFVLLEKTENWQQTLAVTYVVPVGIFLAWLSLWLWAGNKTGHPHGNSNENTSTQKHWCFYKSSDGATDYRFSFEKQNDGTWRAYIEGQPSYNGRASDAHSTHRLTGNNGRHYVCWTDPLRSLPEAKQVAALWADATQEYIRTGKTF